MPIAARLFGSILLVGFLAANGFGATFCVSDSSQLTSSLITAADNGQQDTIRLVTATYVGNFVYVSSEAFGLTIEGGYSADCANRTILAENTVLDGNHLGSVFVFASNLAVALKVEGVTVRNGVASSTRRNGGGLFVNTAGSFTMEQLAFCSP